MNITVEFPEGPREIPGQMMRRDEMRGARFLVEHPYWSQEIEVPEPYEGYKFEMKPDETWKAVPK